MNRFNVFKALFQLGNDPAVQPFLQQRPMSIITEAIMAPHHRMPSAFIFLHEKRFARSVDDAPDDGCPLGCAGAGACS
eukprot:1777814-Pyramimonas_sp.AAC.1